MISRYVVVSDCPGRSRDAAAGVFRLLLLLATLAAPPAAADLFTYIRAGSMIMDVSTSSNPVNLALDLGYELDTDFADMSVVAEVNRSIDSGKVRRGGELEFESNGLYLMFRSTRSLFATFSVGAVKNKTIEGGTSSTNTGLAIGGSIGIVIGRTRLQIEYTSIANEADFFSVGLAF